MKFDRLDDALQSTTILLSLNSRCGVQLLCDVAGSTSHHLAERTRSAGTVFVKSVLHVSSQVPVVSAQVTELL